MVLPVLNQNKLISIGWSIKYSVVFVSIFFRLKRMICLWFAVIVLVFYHTTVNLPLGDQVDEVKDSKRPTLFISHILLLGWDF